MSRNQPLDFDEGHLQFCTSDHQRDLLERRISGATYSDISKDLGINESSVRRALTTVYLTALRSGYAPSREVTQPLPDNLSLHGVTNLYKVVDGERVLSRQYVMGRRAKDEDIDRVIEAIESACENIRSASPIKSPKTADKDILNLVHCTDYHLAAYAAHEESGADWDMRIAKSQFIKAIVDLVEAAPKAHTGIFSQGGDFLHYDSLEALTPANKHLLDADGRAFKMVQLALEMHIFAVEHMLQHHKKVIVIVQEGNHDPMSSIWLKGDGYDEEIECSGHIGPTNDVGGSSKRHCPGWPRPAAWPR